MKKEVAAHLHKEFSQKDIPVSASATQYLARIEGIERLFTEDFPSNDHHRPECLQYNPYDKSQCYHFRYPQKLQMHEYLKAWIDIPKKQIAVIPSTAFYSLIRYCEENSRIY
ncbi:MAG: hypothetical protein ACQESG_04000 [Nanobdellota archaeon]